MTPRQILDAVWDAELHADGWGFCPSCWDIRPHTEELCLVCGNHIHKDHNETPTGADQFD